MMRWFLELSPRWSLQTPTLPCHPLLLSAGAQQKVGLVIGMGNHTIYSRTLDKELELIMHNGLPSVALHPGEPGLGNIVLNAIEEQHDIQDILQNDHVVEDDDTVKYVDTVSEEENKKVNKGGSDYMPISEGKVEIMTRRQRKHLQESLDEVEKEDCAMWSTLSPNYKRPRRMLPQGCKSFLMEIFAGVATLSCIAVVKLGLKMSAAIDVAYDDRYNLLKKSNRDYLEKLVEDEDPFLLSLAPVCGRWSSWQYVNMSKDEDTREKIIQQRKEWYPVLQCVAKIIRSRLAKGREVLAENPWPSLLWRLRCVEDLTAEPVYKASGAGED